MLPHGYLLPQVVAVVLARPLAQRDMWGRHSRSLGDRRARLRGVQEGVFLAGGIRRAYPHVGEGRTWRGRAVIITIIITIIINVHLQGDLQELRRDGRQVGRDP